MGDARTLADRSAATWTRLRSPSSVAGIFHGSRDLDTGVSFLDAGVVGPKILATEHAAEEPLVLSLLR